MLEKERSPQGLGVSIFDRQLRRLFLEVSLLGRKLNFSFPVRNSLEWTMMHTEIRLSMRHAWPQKVPEVAAAALGKERKDCGLSVGTKTKVFP